MTIELDPNIDVFEKHIRISDEGFCTTSTLKLLHCFGMDRVSIIFNGNSRIIFKSAVKIII